MFDFCCFSFWSTPTWKHNKNMTQKISDGTHICWICLNDHLMTSFLFTQCGTKNWEYSCFVFLCKHFFENTAFFKFPTNFDSCTKQLNILGPFSEFLPLFRNSYLFLGIPTVLVRDKNGLVISKKGLVIPETNFDQ